MSSRSQKLVALAMAQGNESSEEEFIEDSDDSIKDKNYFPDESSSDSCESEANLEVEESENDDNQSKFSRNNDQDDWKEVNAVNQKLFNTNCELEDVFTTPVLVTTPFDFFKLFVSDDLLDLMVDETNRYAESLKSKNKGEKARIKAWQPVTRGEMFKFCAVVLAMGLVDLPKINLYWSKDTLYHNEFVTKCLPRDRFLLILRCWHFVDNSLNSGTDKLFKLRNLIDPIIQKFQEFIIPGESVVIDESMVPWRGRLQFRQYIKNKSHKYGVKVYKLCTVGGYILNFKIYSGKGDTTSGKGHADAIVKELMTKYVGKGRTLFVDNFYTSIPLAKYLFENQTRLCGTVRKNRRGFPKDFFIKKVKKGNIYGLQKGPIKIIKWTDKKPVCMLSTCEDHIDALVDTGKIKNGEQVQKPKCVLDYNKAKKGVDYSDQMSSYQNVLRKGMKWYRKVAMEIIFGAAMTNAWLLYNAKFPDKKLSILDFKDGVCKGLFEHSLKGELPRPLTPKRLHTLTEGGPDTKKRRKCKGCYKILRQSMGSRAADNKVKKVFTFCIECDGNPGYCLPCFNQAHSMGQIS